MRRITFAVLCVASTIAFSSCGKTMGSAARTAPAGPVYTASASQNAIPASTELVIRTNETIAEKVSTDRPVVGQTYDSEIARPVLNIDGTVLIPEGSPAELVVLQARTPGAFGTAELQLGIRSVTVNGVTYMVRSTPEAERGTAGLGANRRTLTWVGGGAALGTIIGAIAGGGAGAAIGAAVGAASGATGQVLTRGNEVRVPAESLLTFELQEPLQLIRQ